MDICRLAGSTKFFGTKGLVKISGKIDGYPFQASFMAMGDGQHMLPIKAETRKAIGKDVGQTVPIILAHKSLGGDCCGCIVDMNRGDGLADLICNECGQYIRTVPPEDIERELAGLAVNCGFSVYPCSYCGSLNICTELAFAKFLVCPRCGTEMTDKN